MFESDPDLVVEARAGQTGAFDTIMSQHWEVAKAFVRGRHGSYFDDKRVEEIVEAAFVAAWQGIGSLRHPLKFGQWFSRILRNTCNATYHIVVAENVLVRGSGSEADLFSFIPARLVAEIEDAIGEDNPLQGLVRKELVEDTRAKMLRVYEQLTKRGKQVFLAMFVAGMTETESHRNTGIDIGTIRSSKNRIYVRLRSEFDAEAYQEVPRAELKYAIAYTLAKWSAPAIGE